ncbi:MAG: lysophospholipid acyltransferase family protein [Muribaculaceae bacterium]|nr:lysophospholipid acyltransferase family protein [Muribaculaceae bacterium]
MAEEIIKETENIRPDVLTADDIIELVPRLSGHRRLVERLVRWTHLEDVNRYHRLVYDTPGPRAATRLIYEAFGSTMRVDNADILDRLPEGAFITVSNHPFGAVDGIALISLIGEKRPEFKVMVNMILNRIGALRPNFIAVDPLAQNDPAKKAVSINGIRACLRQIKEGKPLGFFPAGAMSKTNRKGQLEDRPWQDSVLQLIYRSNVPVVPVFFHGSNSRLFNFVGHVCWPLRSLMLPREVVRKCGSEVHVSIGEPISVEEQRPYRENAETLGRFLRERTYALRNLK